MDLQPYRVKPGAVLPHAGLVLTSGTNVELAPHVAYEVRHLVDPVDAATGAVKAWGSADQAALETELAKARPHERVSILEQAIAAKKGDLDVLQTLHAAAKREEAEATKALQSKAEKPKSAPPAAGGDKV